MSSALLKQLPSIDKLLASAPVTALVAEFSREEVVALLREQVDRTRAAIRAGAAVLPVFASSEYATGLRAELMRRRMDGPREVINATGIVIHTNLGRAPLAPAAVTAIERVAAGYSNLEFDLEHGRRGSRHQHAEGLLTRITGAEAALVVNNCAAAIMLALGTFARGAEVIVSRGELIEIGGAFRMPDVVAQSGARLVEVGTTNKTKLEDYGNAIGTDTRVLLATHPSNYQIVGFTAKPALHELAALAHERGVLLIQDLGSGTLVDLSMHGLREPTVQESVSAGVDLITFSGDKLLGGPQAGILLGRRELIDAIRRNPLLRALRIDKLSLAGLVATLRLYLPPHDACREIPVLRMLTEEVSSIAKRASKLAGALRGIEQVEVELKDDVGYAGGGSLPVHPLLTRVVRLRHAVHGAEALAAKLRATDPPVIARIVDDALTLDPRTVLPDQMPALLGALRQILA